jgi:hypothetical protein
MDIHKVTGLLGLLLIFTLPVFAFEVSIEVEETVDINAPVIQYQYGAIDVSYTLDYIDFFWKLSVCNDNKYQPTFGDDLFFGYYFFLENGGFTLKYNSFNLTVGRTALSDVVDTPYSLFISSKIIPALLADISFDDGTFFYTSRWTELNRNSALDFPDRGWQYNTYGIYLGDFRIGFQDSQVYTGRSFDPEYFLNPLPSFFRQYSRVSPGRPWQILGNENSIMGFFVEYTLESIYTYGQILIDDLNANAIFNPDSFQNPNKIAWSLGGSYDFNFGKIGFYHAGATKYTFQSSGGSSTDKKYGYSFYPAATYTANGIILPIKPEDNYLGYYNGENNVSFLGDYEGTMEGIDIYGSLEFSISADKSPANPWHEYLDWTEDDPAGTHLLDSELLEKKLVFTVGVSRLLTELGLKNLKLSATLELGYIWNVLKLVDIPSALQSPVNDIQYWSPSSENQAVFSLSIGAIYTF